MSIFMFFDMQDQIELNAKNCSAVSAAVVEIDDPVEWAYTNAG
jgi:hypothetical protein